MWARLKVGFGRNEGRVIATYRLAAGKLAVEVPRPLPVKRAGKTYPSEWEYLMTQPWGGVEPAATPEYVAAIVAYNGGASGLIDVEFSPDFPIGRA